MIERNCRAQAQLLDDALELSRIASGTLRLDVRPCDLASVIFAAIDVVRPAANAKSIRLSTEINADAGPFSCDDMRMQQVVWNLLANAVKFTPRRGDVRVTLNREDSHLRLVVTDTGQGIDGDVLPYVFDRFRQGDSGTQRKLGGLGLGLSIVKHIVGLHGGTVEASSDGRECGATFIVHLPIQAIQVSVAPPRKELMDGAQSVLGRCLGAVRLDYLSYSLAGGASAATVFVCVLPSGSCEIDV